MSIEVFKDKVSGELGRMSGEKVLVRESEGVLLIGEEKRLTNCKGEWLEKRTLKQM